ncbi:MAG: WG repeat-containing protein [Cytophagaceae bacterium]|nr:WG repeat-containing protein [Cytophagaceae bacterium]
MKKFFTLFFLLPFFLNAQQVAKYSKILPENELGLRKVELFNGRYGYINQKEKEVIPPVYISISDFNNGVIWAQSEDRKFHVLDSKNTELVPGNLTYCYFDGLKSDNLILNSDKLYGRFDTKKKSVIIPIEFQSIYSLKDSKEITYFRAYKNQFFGVFDTDGKEIIPFKYSKLDQIYGSDLLIAQSGENFGVINLENKTLIPFQYKDLQIINNDNSKNHKFIVKKVTKSGVVNNQNEIIIPFKYDNLSYVNLGYIATVNLKKGLINASQEWLIDPIYEDLSVSYLTSDEFSAKMPTGWGWTNFEKKTIVPFVYNQPVEGFENGYARVIKNNKYGLVDRDGKEIIKPQYEYLRSFNDDGLAIFQINKKFGLIDKTNKIVAPPKYSDIDQLGRFGLNKVAIIDKTDGYGARKFGMIDSKGKEIIKPIYQTIGYVDDKGNFTAETFDNQIITFNYKGEKVESKAYEIIENLGSLKIAKSNLKYGLIDENEKVIIPFQYLNLSIIDYGHQYFKYLSFQDQSGKWGIVGYNGEVKLPAIYDGAFSLAGMGKYLITNKNGFFGVLDLNFKEKIPFVYSYVGVLNDEFLRASKSNKTGIIDLLGNEVLPLKYDEVYDLYKGTFMIKIGEMTGFYNSKTKFTSAIEFKNVYSINKGWIASKDSKYGVLSIKMETVIPFEYEKLESLEIPNFLVFLKNQKKGILGIENSVLLDANYDDIKYLSETFISIGINGKYGLFNIKTKKKWDLEYDKIEKMYLNDKEVFKVSKNAKIGLIDADNKEVVAKIYDEVRSYNSQYFQVRSGTKWGLLDLGGKEILKPKYSLISSVSNNRCVIKENSKFGVVDFLDKIIIQPTYDQIEITSNYNIKYKKGSKWGLCDQNGKVLTDPKYDEIGYFSNTNRARINMDGKFGLIDHTGMELISPIYEDLQEDNSSNITRVKSNGKWGIIDNACRQPIPPDFEEITSFHQDRARYKKNGKYGLVNKYGIILTDKLYDKIDFGESGYDYTGFYVVSLNNKMGYINTEGKETIPVQFENAYKFENNYAIIANEKKFGLINSKGKLVVPSKYDQLGSNTEGFLSFRLDNQWGVVDLHGNEILSAKYDEVNGYQNGKAIVRKGSKVGLIDISGKEIFPTIYSNLSMISFGLYVARKDSVFGLLSQQGETILDFNFQNIIADVDYLGNISIQKNDKWSVYNLVTGKILFDYKYDDQLYFREGFSKIKLNGYYGVIDLSGKIILPPKFDSIDEIYGDTIRAVENGVQIEFDKTGKKLN